MNTIFIGIAGGTGSGKSTLLRCINLLETPTSGEILFHGQSILTGKVDRCAYRAKVGMVFQSFNLFPQYTALENVTLAAKIHAKNRPDFKQNRKAILAEIEENGKALLKKVGLSDKMNNYPCELSGGQQQRVSIARAMALKPKILFFDEPTSALDPISTSKIEELAMQLKENYTIVMVTHNMHQALELGNRTLMMDSGRIVLDVAGEERGKMTVDDLLAQFKAGAGKALDTDRILLSE